MVRQGLGGVMVVWAFVTSACSGSTGGGVNDAKEFPRAFAKGVCASLARCCEHQSHVVNVADCEQRLESSLAREVADYDGLSVRFDASAAEACLGDYANAACLSGPSEGYDVKRHCNAMFQGLIQPGGACRKSDECQVQGNRNAFCQDGTCQLDSEPAAPGELGAACGGTCKNSYSDDRACVPPAAAFNDPAQDSTLPLCFTSDGLHCGGNVAARTCQPLVPEGGSCAGSSQGCAAGTFCDLATRICRPQTDSGPCGPEANGCSATSTCDFASGSCVPVGSPVGARCGANADCASGYCNPSSVCQEPYSATFCAQPEL